MGHRARVSSLLLCLALALVSVDVVSAQQKFGINYGQIANNLPDPTQVAGLLQSLNVNKVKLYDADPKVLTSFANTGVEFIISVGNENLQTMANNPGAARQWVTQHVQPFIPATRITCIIVGNEVFSSNDIGMMASLLPAMQAVHGALGDLGLGNLVTVSSAHSVNFLATSYPPSSGAFQEDLAEYIQPLLDFHGQTGSPLLINAYPFFAYEASPGSVSLPYVLFEPNPGVRDPNTNLTYDNMLYAQIDAVYAAMKAMGHTDVGVRISETGWPSKGDEDETGATVQNAAAYNGNLMQRIAMNQGTPLKPEVPIDVYVFALFNEDMKPGPTSERNYGLFYPNGSRVYALNAGSGGGSGPGGSFNPYYSSMFSSSSQLAITFPTGVVVLFAALFL
ncbi:glucan endo-1,3-beta-glucosidase 14-like isoform X2 [Phragmites australis]|uniref:glucan endo-1,3-beta-glucosidase 14-like isoform X2 n=1 Tax=Phragmites australis TaxID=29695 RepID=UPI002D79088B|nr:glucan endo-1,3-beta-glucosidase 14-like isoform X2 [Phragmites australis]